MNKETIVRQVKKTYLLFKKDRVEKHRIFNDEIGSILDEKDYYFIESETLQAYYVKAMHDGVGSLIHSNYNNYNRIDLNAAECQKLSKVDEVKISNASDWLCVFPTEWRLCGGFLIQADSLFLNFMALSYAMQDDFDVYDGSLNNMIVFRGDRLNEELRFCKVILRGEYFSFFVDLI